MKKLISSLIISLSVLMTLTCCSLYGSPSEIKTDSITIKHDSTQEIVTDSTTILHEVTQANESTQEMDKEIILSDYFLYSSLGLNVICIFLIILILKKIGRINKKIRTKNNDASRFSMESYPSHNHKREIEDALNRFRFPESEINRVEGIIWNRLKNHLQKKQDNTYINNSISNNSHVSNDRSKLYASQCNSNNNTFYNVTKSPNESTVYELEVNGNQAEFVLYGGAIKKVTEAPDFLVSASDLQIMDNHTTARTYTKGKAILKGDGYWAVDTKARIIFE